MSTAEFASHMTTIQNMCSKVDFLIGEQGEEKKVINEHTRHLDALEQQVTDLQDRSRRSNLRLLGLSEGPYQKVVYFKFILLSILK